MYFNLCGFIVRSLRLFFFLLSTFCPLMYSESTLKAMTVAIVSEGPDFLHCCTQRQECLSPRKPLLSWQPSYHLSLIKSDGRTRTSPERRRLVSEDLCWLLKKALRWRSCLCVSKISHKTLERSFQSAVQILTRLFVWY